MKLASFLSAAAVLGISAMASAQVNVIVTHNGTVDDPGVAGTQTLDRYTISFQAVSGVIGGFDFDVTGTGIYQIQTNGFLNAPQDTVYEDNLAGGGAAYVNADTHLLFTASELVAVTLPSEGNEGVSLGADSAHHGTSLSFNSGEAGIIGAQQTALVPILQLVLAPGGSATLTGFASITGETSPRTLSATVIPVPEPTSLALIGVGALALARRRMA